MRGGGRGADLKFTHLTTKDGLSQGYVVDILQDRRGFMWFATRDGLNRYDGHTFVVYKHDPNDPGSLSSSFIQDLMEDDHGYLWVATNNGVNRFDPTTERCTRYLHDPNDPGTLGGASVKSVAQDRHGHLWFGTEDSGLDRLDPGLGTFTHHRNDSDGRFVGRITQVIDDRQGDVWFTGERGLFHVNEQDRRITRRPAAGKGLSADSVYEDEAGDLWLLANSPVVGLVRYDPRTERLTSYPLAARAGGALASTTRGGSLNGILAADGQNGLWVPSSEGLSYFDRRTERFTHRFRHDDANPHSLDSNAIFSVYQDRGGVLWVGTESSGLNILNFRQQQFGHHMHRPADPSSLSPGRVKAIHQDPDGVLWVGSFPRALDRVDRKTGKIIHYIPGESDGDTLGAGTNVNGIYRDPSGHLWVGGGGSGLVRLDERTGRFKHYRHDPRDPRSLISNNVYTIYGDRSGQMWVGLEGGISRFDPATDAFVNYRPIPDNPASLSQYGVDHLSRSFGGAVGRHVGRCAGPFRRQGDGLCDLRPRLEGPAKTQRRRHQHHPRRPGRDAVGGNVRRTLPARPPERGVRSLHRERGPAQQQHSMHPGRSARQAVAEHSEGRLPVRSPDPNVQELRRVRRPAERRIQHRVLPGPGWGDLLRRQQRVQRIRPRERPGRPLHAAGRDHELHHLQRAGGHRG